MSSELSKENPYVAVVAKKHRNLKKKLERIAKIEQQLTSGKPLDSEQQQLFNSKGSVEKAVKDLASLKQQLEEVALQQSVSFCFFLSFFLPSSLPFFFFSFFFLSCSVALIFFVFAFSLFSLYGE
jgi:hypothetical protein